MNSRSLLAICAFLLVCNPGYPKGIPADKKRGCFIENKGQFRDQSGNPNPDVLYMADLGGLKVLLRKDGFSYETYEIRHQWVDPQSIPYKIRAYNEKGESFEGWPGKHEADKQLVYHYHRVDIHLKNCNASAIPQPTGEVATGNRWVLMNAIEDNPAVGQCNRLTYKNIYPGIDLTGYIDPVAGNFKFDFFLGPDADLSQLKLEYNGATDLRIDTNGNLLISTRFGEITESLPACYLQDKQGEKVLFDGISYELEGNIIRYHSRYEYDSRLIIDPSVGFGWAEYYGGDSADYCIASVANPDGEVFLCGTTHSLNIATAGAWQDSLLLSPDGFLMRIDEEGQILWTTYLAGFLPSDIEWRKDSSLILVNSNSILCLNDDGVLLWRMDDAENRVAVASDPSNNIITAGDSVVKRNSQGMVEWKIKIGGNGTWIKDVGCDAQGNIYFAGHTEDSAGVATQNAYQATYNGTHLIGTGHDYNWELVGQPRAGDACFGKITAGGQVEFASYYGGFYFDEASRIAVSDSGYFALVGSTNSRDGISTPGSYQDTLRPQGVYCFTQILIGGSWHCPEGYWQYLDTCISGCFAPYPLYDDYCQSTDAFVALFNNQGARIFGTYYGDTDSEFGMVVEINSAGDTVTLSGITTGNNPACYSYNSIPRPFTYYPPNLATPYSTNTTGAKSWIAQFGLNGERISGTYFPPPDSLPVEFIEPRDISFAHEMIRLTATANEEWEPGNYNSGTFDALVGFLRVSGFNFDTIVQQNHLAPCLGDSVYLTTGVLTTPPTDLDFQWYKNNEPLTGKTDSALFIPAASVADTGEYACHVTKNGFSWWTTGNASFGIRSTPALNTLSSGNQVPPLADARMSGDLDQSGSFDVVSQGKITYNDSLIFTRNDSIPSLFAQTSFVDPFNENTIALFTHDPACLDYPACSRVSKLIRKTEGGYMALEDSLLNGIAVWADFDNDGTQEGFRISAYQWAVYLYLVKIKSDTIYQVPAGMGSWDLWATCDQRAEAADYDHDGDVDILFVGTIVSCSWNKIIVILKNTGGIFSELPLLIIDHERDGYAQWFDADADGDLDILIRQKEFAGGGFPEYNRILSVYSNVDNHYQLSFSDTLRVDQQGQSKPVVFDYDNDGLPDIALQNFLFQRVDSTYLNQPTSFSIVQTGLTEDAMAVGDLDRDGDLDVVGNSRLFINDVCNPPNTPPTVPGGMASSVAGDTVALSWLCATDAATPSPGLTYNLRVGSTPGGHDLMSPLANSTGWRKIAAMGNVFQNTSWHLHSLAPGTYYWSVQAIDNSYAGGPFATEQTFTILPSIPATIAVAGDTIGNGGAECYSALQTITVPGDGNPFLVQAGGSATFVAGEKIRFLPALTVDPGGYLQGYITTTYEFCPQPMMPAGIASTRHNEVSGFEGVHYATSEPGVGRVTVYPNPTWNSVTVRLTLPDLKDHATLVLRNLYGDRLGSYRLAGSGEIPIDLASCPPGIYLLTVTSEHFSGTVRIVRM